MITKDSVIAFFKKVWNTIKTIIRKLIKLSGILKDIAKLAFGLCSTIEKGIGIFKTMVQLFKVAVKDGNDIIECICEPNGDVVYSENHSQIIQGEEIDSEARTEFRNGNDVIAMRM